MIKVNVILGAMPSAWNRQVIFFANLLSLFYGNEEETQVLRDEVGTLETYGGRLIPIINLLFNGPDNLLILESPPHEALLEYFQNTLGLNLPKIEIVTHQLYASAGEAMENPMPEAEAFLSMLRTDPAPWMHGYVTDRHLKRLADLSGKKTISTYQGGRKGNNKLLLYEYLLSSGLPGFDTCIAETPAGVSKCLEELKAKGYSRAVIKSQIGASGIGMGRIDLNNHGSEDIPEYLFFEGPCLVQGWLDETCPGIRYVGSPSVQMVVKDDVLSIYDLTEQILSRDSIHEGNVAPPVYLAQDQRTRDELLRQAQICGTWLYDQGYRGTASVDFLVLENNGQREVRVCEINARVTGATYPAILARYFRPQGAWLMRNIRFIPPRKGTSILKILEKDGLLFHPSSVEGILPINLNNDGEGRVVKGQFLFLAETVPDTFRLLEAIGRIASIRGRYDRD